MLSTFLPAASSTDASISPITLTSEATRWQKISSSITSALNSSLENFNIEFQKSNDANTSEVLPKTVLDTLPLQQSLSPLSTLLDTQRTKMYLSPSTQESEVNLLETYLSSSTPESDINYTLFASSLSNLQLAESFLSQSTSESRFKDNVILTTDAIASTHALSTFNQVSEFNFNDEKAVSKETVSNSKHIMPSELKGNKANISVEQISVTNVEPHGMKIQKTFHR
ncbi:unnamed protein product [Thelazia callipaeda]|uniref:Orphan protein n=1 Tax=Thelazia callipaeda TaxID=103827 RepID=A0A0N5CTV0_THECL|nr:unnamed protein product [Thelazia callipaeda]